MPYVLKLVQFVGIMEVGKGSEIEGSYLKNCDFISHNGRGIVDVVDDPKDAMVFDSPVDALDFWNTETPYGRPLRAYTVEVLTLERAVMDSG